VCYSVSFKGSHTEKAPGLFACAFGAGVELVNRLTVTSRRRHRRDQDDARASVANYCGIRRPSSRIGIFVRYMNVVRLLPSVTGLIVCFFWRRGDRGYRLPNNSCSISTTNNPADASCLSIFWSPKFKPIRSHEKLYAYNIIKKISETFKFSILVVINSNRYSNKFIWAIHRVISSPVSFYV